MRTFFLKLKNLEVENNYKKWDLTTYPSHGSKITIRGGHSPLSIMLLHVFKVSVSSLDKTCINKYQIQPKSLMRMKNKMNKRILKLIVVA